VVQAKIHALVKEHGTVPPALVIFDEHPYSICWRMGSGESYLRLWWDWWQRQGLTEEQRIAYFRRWPPPHSWLVFLIGAVGCRHVRGRDKPNPILRAHRHAGLRRSKVYERDLDDPKWLER
jgi:hypothetical protein